jgi:hypothetical protein
MAVVSPRLATADESASAKDMGRQSKRSRYTEEDVEILVQAHRDKGCFT